ncbi:MAG: ImmA/IrrE family metallo-endopeptidase [Afipia felis]|nr:ImmA/IrrE family metallo-endopeptidase [Afipia felis]
MVDYRTDEQLEETGRKFLRQIGLEGQHCPDPMTIITKLRRLVPKFKYRRIPDIDLPDAEAMWDSNNFELVLRESVYIGMQRGDTHFRFVFFHELAHYVLGHPGVRNRILDPKLRNMSAIKVKHFESEANRLAVIMMAPEHLVPAGASAEQISSMFGLSPTAAIIRKDEVDRIRRRRSGQLRPIPESIKELLRNARDQGFPIQTQVDD